MDKFLLKKQKREAIIREASPWRAIFYVCFPMIILVTIQAGYNVLDKIIAIHCASNDVAKYFSSATIAQQSSDHSSLLVAAGSLINLATQYAGNIFNLVWAFAVLAAMGASISFSMKFGAKDKKGMEQAIGNGIYLSIFSSIVLMIITILVILPQFNYPLLNAQADIGNRNYQIVKALDQLGFQYSLLIAISTPISYLNFLFLSLLRSEGRIGFLIIVSSISLVLNGVLSYIFTGLCHMMLWGAMTATILALLFSLICSLLLIFFSPNTHIKLTRIGFHFDRNICFHIFMLGISGLVVNLSAVLVSMLETNLTGALPSGGGFSNNNANLQTVYSAISPWIFLTLAPAFGVWQGSAALIGYAYGAKKYHRCWSMFKRIILLLFIWFLFDYIMFASIGKYMLALFDDNTSGHNLLLFLNFVTYPFATISYACLIFNQSINKGKLTLVITLVRALAVPIPIIFLAFGISNWVQDPVVFFGLYGCCDFISGIIILIINIFVLKPYYNHMTDISIINWNSTFKTFNEIDYNRKLLKLRKKEIQNHKKIKQLENLLKLEYNSKKEFVKKLDNNI